MPLMPRLDLVPRPAVDSDVQSLFDGQIEQIAQDLTALSAHVRNHRADLLTPDAMQDRVDRLILAYLELRCACGSAATMDTCCPTCYAARQADSAACAERSAK